MDERALDVSEATPAGSVHACATSTARRRSSGQSRRGRAEEDAARRARRCARAAARARSRPSAVSSHLVAGLDRPAAGVLGAELGVRRAARGSASDGECSHLATRPERGGVARRRPSGASAGGSSSGASGQLFGRAAPRPRRAPASARHGRRSPRASGRRRRARPRPPRRSPPGRVSRRQRRAPSRSHSSASTLQPGRTSPGVAERLAHPLEAAVRVRDGALLLRVGSRPGRPRRRAASSASVTKSANAITLVAVSSARSQACGSGWVRTGSA